MMLEVLVHKDNWCALHFYCANVFWNYISPFKHSENYSITSMFLPASGMFLKVPAASCNSLQLY